MCVYIYIYTYYAHVMSACHICHKWMSFGFLKVILLNPAMMYIMNRLEDRQQAQTDERVRKATEVTPHDMALLDLANLPVTDQL